MAKQVNLTDLQKRIIQEIVPYLNQGNYQHAVDEILKYSSMVDDTYNVICFIKSHCGIDLLKNISRIPNEFFWGNTDIESIHLHENIEWIGYSAFQGCENLRSVVIDSGLKGLGENAFADCANLTEITLPSTITSSGKELFYKCTNLKNINFDGTEQEFRTLDKNSLDINWMYGSYIDTITCLKDNKVIH